MAWVWAHVVYAQPFNIPQEPSFGHIGLEDGLSQSIVSSIIKDQDGFMWFGTRDGLNRWDGYSFRVYRNSPFNERTVIGAGIDKLILDEKGRLWAASVEGYSRYNPATEDFQQFRSPAPTSMRSGVIRHGKYFYNVSVGNEVLEFNSETGKFRKGVSFSSGALTMLSFQGHIYVGGVGMMCLLNVTDLSCNPLLRTPNTISILALDHEDSEGFWGFTTKPNVQAHTDLVLFNAKGEIKKTITLKVRLPLPYQIRKMGQNMFISTNSGLFVVDLHRNALVRTFLRSDKKNGLGNHDILALYFDEQESVWLGTFGGVYRLRLNKPSFYLFRNQPGHANSLSSSDVNGMFEGRDGKIWIATADGLNRFDPNTEQFERYLQPVYEGNTNLNNIWNVLEAQDGAVWLGTKANCLWRLDRTSRKFIEEKRLRCFGTGIRVLKESKSGKLLIGSASGLILFDPHKGKMEQIGYDPNNEFSLTDGRVNAIYEAPDETLWVGTDVGLNHVDLKRRRIVAYRQDVKKKDTISNNNIWNILPDQKHPNILWLGTIGGGLNRFDIRTGKSTHVRAEDGLPSNVIYGLLLDKSGRLWMSTSAGIAHFDPNQKNPNMVSYREKDGLQGLEYNLMSYLAARNGSLYFGGPNGLNRLEPMNIGQSDFSPPLVISLFRIGYNHLRSIRKSGDRIVIQHNENNFSIEFAALDYADPYKNQYQYKLEGFDTDWMTQSGRRPAAHYTNVPPGDYIFEVRGSNSDGRMNPNNRLLVYITIKSEFWQTWWFQLGLAFLVVMGYAFLYVRHQKHKKHEAARILAEEREIKKRLAESRDRERLRIAQELHDGPMQQLYTIGHQLDGLAVIAPQSQIVRANLNKVAAELREVVGELRPAMLRLLGLQPALKALIRRIEKRTPDLVITTKFETDGKAWSEELQHALYRILQEVMSNVLKHAGASEVHIQLLETEDKVRFIISDNGKGFTPPDKLVDLARANHYGLLGCVERAEILNGTAHVQSIPHHGTKVIVEIPLALKDAGTVGPAVQK